MKPSAPPGRNSTKGMVVFLVVLVAFGCSLRFYRLTEQSLWFDEGISLAFSDGSSPTEVIQKLGSVDTSERYQPLYFVLLSSWRGLFGSSEPALKSLSAILSTLALIAFVPVTWHFLDPRARPGAVGFMALSSFAVYYAQEVRPYSLLLLLCVGYWLCLAHYLRTETSAERSRRLAPVALTSFIGGLASLFFSLFVMSAGVAWLATRGKGKRAWSFWIVSGLALLPSFLFFAWADSQSGQAGAYVSRTDNSLVANACFSIYGLLAGTTFGPPVSALREVGWVSSVQQAWLSLAILAVTCIAVATAAAAAFSRASRWNAREDIQRFQFPFWMSVIGVAVLGLFAFVTKLNWLPRHSTFLLPGLALALGNISSLPLELTSSPRWRKLGSWSVAVLLLLNVVSLGHYFFNTDHRKDDYRAVAALLKDQQPIPVVLFLGSGRLLDYYDVPDVIDIRWKAGDKKLELIREQTAQADQFLVVINREARVPGGLPAIETSLAPISSLKSVWDFPAFRVALFSRL